MKFPARERPRADFYSKIVPFLIIFPVMLRFA